MICVEFYIRKVLVSDDCRAGSSHYTLFLNVDSLKLAPMCHPACDQHSENPTLSKLTLPGYFNDHFTAYDFKNYIFQDLRKHDLYVQDNH